MANRWYRESIDAWTRQLEAENAGVELPASETAHSVWRRAKVAPEVQATHVGDEHKAVRVLREEGITIFACPPGANTVAAMLPSCAGPLMVGDCVGPPRCRQAWRAFRRPSPRVNLNE